MEWSATVMAQLWSLHSRYQRQGHRRVSRVCSQLQIDFGNLPAIISPLHCDYCPAMSLAHQSRPQSKRHEPESLAISGLLQLPSINGTGGRRKHAYGVQATILLLESLPLSVDCSQLLLHSHSFSRQNDKGLCRTSLCVVNIRKEATGGLQGKARLFQAIIACLLPSGPVKRGVGSAKPDMTADTQLFSRHGNLATSQSLEAPALISISSLPEPGDRLR